MSTDEAVALREELLKAQQKLAEWKEKAKRGVDQLREQLVELSDQHSKTKSERDALRAQAHVAALSSECMQRIPMFQPAFVETLFEATIARSSVFTESSIRVCTAPAGQQQSYQELQSAHEKYRRRAEQSIKLSSKQQEAMSAENKELQKQLDDTLKEMEQRDQKTAEMRESLEKQLDTALYAIDTLRSDLADRNLQAQQRAADSNDRQWVSVDEAKAEIESMHQQFVDREEELRRHHVEEIERLHHTHEEAISLLEDELNEALTRSTHNNNVSSPHLSTIRNDGEFFATDEAYASLLIERDALKTALAERESKIVHLERRSVPRASSCDGETTTLVASPSHSSTDRIATLEQQVKSLSEQLWVANNAILETKAKRASEKGGKSGEGQQMSYLKSIVVKLLCEKGDDVRSNLVPVLATLLFLDAEDLRAIYTANPTWGR